MGGYQASFQFNLTDLLQGPGADWGTLNCGCHPDCGIGMGFMVSKKTKEWAPLSAFLDVEGFLKAGRGGLLLALPTLQLAQQQLGAGAFERHL